MICERAWGALTISCRFIAAASVGLRVLSLSLTLVGRSDVGRVPAGEVIGAGIPTTTKGSTTSAVQQSGCSFLRVPNSNRHNWKDRDRILQSVGLGALDISESEQTGNDPCRALTSNKRESRSPAADQVLFFNPWHSFLRTLATGNVSCSCGRRAQGALAVSTNGCSRLLMSHSRRCQDGAGLLIHRIYRNAFCREPGDPVFNLA